MITKNNQVASTDGGNTEKTSHKKSLSKFFISPNNPKVRNYNFKQENKHIIVNPGTIKKETAPGGLVWIKTPCEGCGCLRYSHKYFIDECEHCRTCAQFKTPLEVKQVKQPPTAEPKVFAVVNGHKTRVLEHDGVLLSIGEWALKLSLKKTTIERRLDRGWSIKEALENKQ